MRLECYKNPKYIPNINLKQREFLPQIKQFKRGHYSEKTFKKLYLIHQFLEFHYESL
ncbi:hypothetical protein HFN_1660 [Helicobacter fennelliae MRY12-0050]|uniref:Uncharacterized protein n=1 Tax=Helicobacter fennelliae MRY12-0050 TaxID=1325130 RepID=T1DUY8_9HELI|nr:hypothetical protein HFN_1660 [Helicobacter fennelliae MRY12-0050]